MEAEMVVVAVAFVIGGVLGAVLTAALIARGQRALELTPSDLELPIRPADRWRAEQGGEPRESDVREGEASYVDNARIERFERELARRLGREAAATVRERREALTRSLRPALGITIRVRD
jgi:hypothetical protein